MTLTDTGPLIALILRADPDHEAYRAATQQLPKAPMLTTWPCLTEAMYLLYRENGFAAQRELWDYLADGILHVHALTGEERKRMRDLMEIYPSAPMDFADASLVAAAESLSLHSVFTIDKHFYAYRLADGRTLEIVP
jgi:predicted nucleic acid-binding protein